MAKGDVRIIHKLFSRYWESVNDTTKCGLIVDDKKEKLIIEFCDKIRSITKSELQLDYLEQYFDFQFQKHYKKKGAIGRGGFIIQLGWIISAKAVKEWQKVNSEDKGLKSFIVRKTLRSDITIKGDVEKQKELNREAFIKSKTEIKIAEEIEKKLHYNTKDGFVWCWGFTSMYNHKSELCAGCIYKVQCKEELKKTNKLIYKIRGYNVD